MKITVEHYDKKVSVEVANDDVAFDDFMELLRTIAHCVGYHPETIEEWFNIDG
jgi:hypothetical protein